MKSFTFARGGEYTAPELELYTAAVENGFQTSLEGSSIEDVTTDDWGTL